ncbi:MAG: hypothetical protein DMG80_17235 [Acidobacteria bacterium]|nr:MAG: hypothetical protein DMG80_17235 [Acidobacteriota bacterium]
MAARPHLVEARMVCLAELAFKAEDDREFQSAIRELRKIIRDYAEYLRESRSHRRGQIFCQSIADA